MTKICSACSKTKPILEFVNQVTGKETRMCTACRAIRIKSRKKNWKTRQEYNRKVLYGMSVGEYDNLLASQNNTCAICERPAGEHSTYKELAVDHDHETGVVRGLLCAQCNVGLGMFQHKVELLLKAVQYLGFRDPIDM